MRVFLGGTCGKSTWREQLMTMLDPQIEVFNPVVDEWNDEAKENEEKEKNELCTDLLYVITSEMTGVYSIAEVVDSSNKRPNDTILCIIPDGFDESQLKSLTAVSVLVCKNGAKVFSNLISVATLLSDKINDIKGKSKI